MFAIYKNNVDISEFVDDQTIKIDTTLNNQANTCSFDLHAGSISEGNEIELWDYFVIISVANIGDKILYVDDTYQYEGKYSINDVIYLDIKNNHIKAIITAIDHTAKNITIQTALGVSLPINTKCGFKRFAGMVLENPEKEIGVTGKFSYSVNVTDYSRRFDAKNVVAVYENMYSREIIGRFLYKYVANDSEVILDDFESAWTAGVGFDYLFWKFDEGSGDIVYDESNNWPGYLTTDNVQFVTGHDGTGYALDFSTEEDRVLFDETSEMRMSEGTIAFWFYRRSVQNGYNYVVDFTDYKVAHSYGSDKKIWLWLNGETTQGWYDSATALADDIWYHIAITFDDSSIKFYINGILDKEYDNYTGPIKQSAYAEGLSYGIGSRSGELFDGKLDNFFLADDVFSAGQIQLVMDDEWLGESVALAMTDDTTDLVEGNKSQQTGTSGSGMAKWTKTITSKDCSDCDAYRLWFKIGKGYGVNILNLSYKIGSSEDDYYLGSSDMIGLGNDDCWNYATFKLSDCEINGVPNLSAITYLEIEIVCDQLIPNGKIHFDISKATEDGFSLNNCERGSNIFERVPSNFRKPTVLVEELSKNQNMYWYIDYDRDLHFFSDYDELSPFNITDTSQNYGDLEVNADLSQLKNRQVIVGDETPSSELYSQPILCDGEAENWNIAYGFNSLKVYLDSGSGYVEKTVGVENLDDPADFDFISNFSNKILKLGSITKPSSGYKLLLTYYPYYPIQTIYTDPTSPAAVAALLGHGDGIFDGALIEDKTISTWADARARAKAEVDAYKNAIVTAEFVTNQDGLKSGQIIHITDTSRGINDDFLIQKVSYKNNSGSHGSYKVTAGSSFFGLIEFFQLLLKKSGKINTTANDVVRISINIDETITLTDHYSSDINDNVYTIGSKYKQVFDFSYEEGYRSTDGLIMSGVKNSGWKVKFANQSTGATATFDAASNYNTGKCLKIIADTGTAAADARVKLNSRLSVSPSTQYNAYAFIEIASDLTNIGANGGCEIIIKEYSDNKADSASITSHTIFSQETEKTDYIKKTLANFTTNGSTNYIDIEIAIYRAAGTLSVGKIVLQDTTTDSEINPGIVGFSMIS